MSGIETTLRRFRWALPFPRRKTIRKYFPRFEDRNIAFILKQKNINTLIDIGANVGQFGMKMRNCGYTGSIVSFEPVAGSHRRLTENAKLDAKWIVAPPMALSAEDRLGTINVMADSSMCSLHEMIDRAPVEKEQIVVRSLDGVLASMNLSADLSFAIKIDVQGHESEVIAGAGETLRRAGAALIEVSLKPTYHGEVYYIDVLRQLRTFGLGAVYFSPVVNKRRLGEMYQVDVLLTRQPPALLS